MNRKIGKISFSHKLEIFKIICLLLIDIEPSMLYYTKRTKQNQKYQTGGGGRVAQILFSTLHHPITFLHLIRMDLFISGQKISAGKEVIETVEHLQPPRIKSSKIIKLGKPLGITLQGASVLRILGRSRVNLARS